MANDEETVCPVCCVRQKVDGEYTCAFDTCRGKFSAVLSKLSMQAFGGGCLDVPIWMATMHFRVRSLEQTVWRMEEK